MSTWDDIRVPVFVGAGTLAASAYVFAFDPSEPGHFLPCPTKVLTGLDCPFCGSLRATHELMHGNLTGALDFNAMTVLFVLPAAVIAWVLWMRSAWREEPSVQVPRWAMATTVVLMLAFTVVRNLPGMPLGTAA